jgi:hypothetical protein
MEPTILALLDAEPDLAAKLDLVVCGSTFGNLLRFVKGDDKRFRILVESINDTVFFVRREKSPTEKIENIYGYGHTFPEAYTSWSAEAKSSESHQRLVKYSFGGLNILIRFEGDGYLPKGVGSTAHHSVPNTLGSDQSGINDLVSGLAATAVARNAAATTSKIRILHGGTAILQEQTFDLKTRSFRKKNIDTIGQELPRLWARQIPNFILAHHHDGLFDDIEIRNVEKDIAKWEEENHHELCKFAILLHKITAFVRSRSKGKIELCFDGGSKLELREQLSDAGDVLSDETKAKWVAAIDDGSKGGVEEAGIERGISIEWSDEHPEYTASKEYCG